jgi:hypothetical protein
MTTQEQTLSHYPPVSLRQRWEGLLTNLADLAWACEQGIFSMEIFQEAGRRLDNLPLSQGDYGNARARLERASTHGRRGDFAAAHCEMRRMMRYMLRIAGREL